ncbi:MFS transporter [Nakamurella antarctica]|uniref:MFS transporter n=1 Tax=Nakamurella antarctica TaxID=1902245 RepID=A0A3G8ZNN2_9ACTN|nr:MFS transporter [Nakamurella antarctica]AZI58853.1 MFS transporter [Nakamurella antarctica]
MGANVVVNSGAKPAGGDLDPTQASPDEQWRERPDIVAIQRRTVRILIAAQIVGGIGIGAGASLGALLAEQVTSSESWAGLARTCSTLGAAAIALPLASMASRRGRNKALGLGWALAAIGGVVLVLSAAFSNIPLLIMGMLMFGSGTATNLQSRYAATDLAKPAHRSRTLSIVVWSTTIGAVLGPNLSGPGVTVAEWFGLPDLSGGFLISAVVLSLGAAAMWIFMRPDPLVTAQHHAPDVPVNTRKQRSLSVTMKAISESAVTRLAFVVVVLGHTVMASVMTMTPVHMADHGASLNIIGLTISVHVFGMYGLSPVVGVISDRLGRIPAIMIGQACFVASALIAGMSGTSNGMVMAGLFLLGLGWSFSLIAGSTLLGESVPSAIRPSVQGTGDMAMNVVAAVASGISGVVMAKWGFGGLNVIAGVLTIPVLLLVLSTVVTGRRSEKV